MFYIHPTEKWIDDVVRSMNENQLKPETSKFMIAFFSSMDNEFVDYFKNNNWRSMRSEFNKLGIPVKTEPTFVFFCLNNYKHDKYEPTFFAGFECKSFDNFPYKLKNAIDNGIEINDIPLLGRKLGEIFLSPNIIPVDQVERRLKQTITNKLPQSTLFISHSSHDKSFARKLIKELSNDKNLKFWIDENELIAGDDIQKIHNKKSTEERLFDNYYF